MLLIYLSGTRFFNDSYKMLIYPTHKIVNEV